jgi:2-haloalkanoic acid dehalogenase type II
MQDIRVCVFDAYGTLFDVAAAARELAAEPGREAFAKVWPQVSADWRLKQLQYSWLRAVTGDYCDFWQVTQDGLDWALARAGQADAELREALLGLYWRLAAYPEVPEMLGTLKRAGLSTAILSNGSPAMLSGAVESAGIGRFSMTCCRSRRWASSNRPRRLRPCGRTVFLRALRGALRVVQRLGRGGGLRLRVPHPLGQPDGRARGQPARTACP